MSYTAQTTQTHDALVRALADMSGQILKTDEIRQLVERCVPELGDDLKWLFPTDLCDNHTVKGACRCAKTQNAPLSRVSRGIFRVR